MQMCLFRRPRGGVGAAALLAAGLLLAPAADAQQAKDTDRPDALVLVVPTGDRTTGSLLLEAAGPAQVPVGQTYEYRVKVANISRNLVLEDVTVFQTRAKGFSIEKSDPEFMEGDDTSFRWSVGKLNPGESKTIRVTAQADEEGEGAGCLRAEYKPSLCLMTRFVKPRLKVTKSAPEQADLCEPLVYKYTVTNTGSGVARGVKLRDDLPDDLTGGDGRNTLEYEVGDLEPGQSRELTAKLLAAKTGDFGSRAVAEGQGDLKASSNKPTTAVRRAELSVDIRGPEAIYVNQPMTYRVVVKNNGEAAARGPRLDVKADPGARLVRTSKADPGGVAPQVNGQNLSWNLGEIAPGQSIAVSLTAIGRDSGELKHTATVTSACSRGGDFAKESTSAQTAQTRIITYPALLLSLVDRVDPVRVGDSDVYRVTVVNQGSGADENVKVTCTLPENFTFVDAQGSDQASNDGRKVTLGPVNRLSPHERAVWDLRVKAEKPGDVRMKVELTSDYLSESNPAVSVEPTRVIGPVAQRSDDDRDRGTSDGAAASKCGDDRGA